MTLECVDTQARSAHMTRVYSLMAGGVAVSSSVAYMVGMSTAALATLMTPYVFVPVLITPFVISYLISARRVRNPVYLTGLFALTTATMGLWLANIAAKAVASTAFASALGLSVGVGAVIFAGLAAYGWFTKRDLSVWGSFLFAALLGLIVAGFANLFLASAGFSLATAAIGVLVFAGLIAFDVQRAKQDYQSGYAGAVQAALNLHGRAEALTFFAGLLLLAANVGARLPSS